MSLHRLLALAAAAQRKHGSLEHVLELGCVGCVDRERRRAGARSTPAAFSQASFDVSWYMPVTTKRRPAVASTSAGTSFEAAADEAGAHIATPATSKKRPSASLVEPGLPVNVISPTRPRCR